MKFFGDKNAFAILFRPDQEFKDEKQHALPFCHFIFNHKIIGDKNEPCFLGTWASSLLYLKNQIVLKKDCLTEPEFEKLSDLEIFELLLKTNQDEADFKENYKHLPRLAEDIWYKYRVDMDETIDRYSIFIVEDNNILKFLWRNHTRKNAILGVMTTTHEQFYDTVDSCLDFLIKEYSSVIGNLYRYSK